MMFRVGDRVRCVTESVVGHTGIIGQEYLVTAAVENEGITISGAGLNRGCAPERFELVSSAPPVLNTPTLRDQFAMAALTSIALNTAHTDAGLEDAARKAYGFADAMLAERERVK